MAEYFLQNGGQTASEFDPIYNGIIDTTSSLPSDPDLTIEMAAHNLPAYTLVGSEAFNLRLVNESFPDMEDTFAVGDYFYLTMFGVDHFFREIAMCVRTAGVSGFTVDVVKVPSQVDADGVVSKDYSNEVVVASGIDCSTTGVVLANVYPQTDRLVPSGASSVPLGCLEPVAGELAIKISGLPTDFSFCDDTPIIELKTVMGYYSFRDYIVEPGIISSGV